MYKSYFINVKFNILLKFFIISKNACLLLVGFGHSRYSQLGSRYQLSFLFNSSCETTYVWLLRLLKARQRDQARQMTQPRAIAAKYLVDVLDFQSSWA